MHLPQENRGIELMEFRFAEGPPDAPLAEPLDDPPEIVPGLSQGVLDAGWLAAAPALDHAAILEMAKPGDEQRS
jgi:hypothetical protein